MLKKIIKVLDKAPRLDCATCEGDGRNVGMCEDCGGTGRDDGLILDPAQEILDSMWTKIEDEYPEDDVWVFVFCKKPSGAKFAAVDKYSPCGFIFNKGIVTHWRKITEPPHE